MVWPITAQNVSDELKWGVVPAVDPNDLALYARGACSRIEREIGPHAGQDIGATERRPSTCILLPWPAETLASVSIGGVAQDLAGFELDGPEGMVYGTFSGGTALVVATAPQGVEAEVELAARVLAATWVKQAKLGPPSPATRATAPDNDVLQGFALPRRVSEMIRPYVPVGGFA